jgi:MFS family permease
MMAVAPAAAGWLRDHFGTRSALMLAAALFLAIVPLLGLFERLSDFGRPPEIA